MTHPTGFVSYVPTGKFWFPRSYAIKLWVHTNHVNVPSYEDGLITWVHDPIDSVTAYTKIKDVFITWSSNTYSLDFLVEWWYYVIAPSPVEVPWGGELSFAWSNSQRCNCLVVATESADRDYYFDLPPSPTDYWPHQPR